MHSDPTTQPFRDLTRRERKDLKVLALFTAVYCRSHHAPAERSSLHDTPALAGLGLERQALCFDCQEFLIYACTRRLKCPLDPKPSCKHCPVHCYRPGHRDRVRAIMRFSGRRLLLCGRLDLLWHYLF